MARDTWLTRRLRAGVPAPRAGSRPEERPAAGHLIVCGDDPLTHRLASELVHQYGRQVTVILPSRRHNHGPQIARLPVRIVESENLDADAFRQARVASADAVAVVRQDDVGNIHAALQAHELNPRVHLVIRMFNLSLGLGIRTLFGNCAVMSDAAMAAPAFVAAALGEAAPVQVRLPGHVLDGVRVIAVTRATRTTWNPPPDRALTAADRLTVVATRTGLGQVVAATNA